MKRKLTPEQQSLVSQHLAFGVWLAKRLAKRSAVLRRLSDGDLIGAAHLGLCTAAARFDASRGHAYMTYASHYVRQCVQDAARMQVGAVTVPRLVFLSDRGKEQISLADRTRSQVRSTVKGVRNFEIHDRAAQGLADNLFRLPDTEALEKSDAEERVEKILSVLDERNQQIMRLRFIEGFSLGQIGYVFGISKERVRQIEEKCLRQLRLVFEPQPA